MYVYNKNFLENLYFNVRTMDVDFEKSGDEVVGIVLSLECDSQFAWIEYEVEFVTTENDQLIKVNNNSDDAYGYTKPVITITANDAAEQYSIINTSENNRTTAIDNVVQDEIITIDSRLGKISSSNQGRNFFEDFNNNFPRLLKDENELIISHPSSVKFNMILPRKVGFF